MQRAAARPFAFPNWSPVPRPPLQVSEIQDPNWLVGFVNGEGSFHIKIAVSKTNISGYAIRLKFSIGQHYRDFELLSSFTRNLSCGYVMLNAKLPNCSFTVTRFSDAVDTIIPFFERYPLEPAGIQKKEIFWIDVELRS
uniref:LAGLIDADG endonuclease n=1 Tax=Morchella brunnea TaxID=1174671 RepID=A0A8K1I5N2_9PEZI|nr:LAGLIDADG endonuclease [Morchella brunnea]UBU98570.1 LAGLIDADG endonuclease [Morchella brunnea]